MKTLITCLRQRVSTMGSSAGCLGDHGSRSHLMWMLETVETDVDLPLDKRVRWLGYVAGAGDFAICGKDSASVTRMMGFNAPVLAMSQGKNETILLAGLNEVMEGLEAIAEHANSQSRFLIVAARGSETAALASFRLGYAQAYMTGNNLIDVDSERERTRAIFHRMYADCGFEIPKSRERSKKTTAKETN
jgi:hypothetical protein